MDIEDFSSRKKFNAWKGEAESFTSRYNLDFQFITNKHGVTVSKSELAEIQATRRLEQQIAREEKKKVERRQVKQGGVAFDTVGGREKHFKEGSTTGISIPKDIDFSKIQSDRKLQEIIDMGERRSKPEYHDERKERMRDNWTRSLEGTFDSLADDLADKIRKLSGDEFYELYLENVEFDFERYDSDGDNIIVLDSMVDRLSNILDSHIKTGGDSDLKGF